VSSPGLLKLGSTGSLGANTLAYLAGASVALKNKQFYNIGTKKTKKIAMF
jgi:hypothetical protein